MSIDQIALLLGYGEVGSFTHAFRRWHGVAPSEAKVDCGSRCWMLEVREETGARRLARTSERRLRHLGTSSDLTTRLDVACLPLAA